VYKSVVELKPFCSNDSRSPSNKKEKLIDV